MIKVPATSKKPEPYSFFEEHIKMDQFVDSNLSKGISPPKEQRWVEEANGHLSDRTRMPQSDDPDLGQEVDRFHKNLPLDDSKR